MREDISLILSKLSGVKKVSHGYMANCPAHDDKHQSLSIVENNGTTLIHCHAGCSFTDILEALKLKQEAIKEKVIVATYDYLDAERNLVYQVVRYHPKSFRHRRKVNGEWVWDRKGISPILYNLPELLKAIELEGVVFIVEGERDCETLKRYGYVATTCSGGANSWRPEFTEMFYKANVVIIPDNDKAGHEYAQGIARLLYGWATSLKLVNPNEQSGADITDYLENHEIETLWNIIEDSPQFIPKGAVTREEFTNLKGHLIYLNGKIDSLKGRKVDKQYKYK